MTGKSKHYTSDEKIFFLQLLEKYKNIIESKKNHHTTLHKKQVAWNQICKEFNKSKLVMQERNVQQLKKLWTNIKQVQKDTSIKERQARISAERGEETLVTEVDPLLPDTMSTVPVLFSSNMFDDEIKDQKQLLQDVCRQNTIEIEIQKTANNELSHESTPNEVEVNTTPSKDIAEILIENSKSTRKRKLVGTEDIINVRVGDKNMIEQERQLAEVKLQHEKRMAVLRETHLREIHKLELRTYLARAELAELLLEKEKNNV